ncbi:chemotaxis protein [Shewanella sp. VB17]|uniref:chemotaxis protein n=1 Tax=Shewanella sp. VB17 TaxID=2739432 RepID=UPI00156457CA|nr:chemotaxis protein [Shewanella sp. VB17]NRD73925.1 chemotaxis protein [Shewanella sp. VB17]
MQIPSSFSSGQAGLQSAQSGLTQATVDVATNAPPAQQTQNKETDQVRPIENVDKTDALVSAIESKNQGQASAQVIETSSETIGSLINIEV